MTVRARRIVLRGAVQGCGVRPALARLAATHGWSGFVQNTAAGVELLIAGDLPDDARLATLIGAAFPAASGLERLVLEAHAAVPVEGFQIRDSLRAGPLTTPIPRDVALCAECLAEARDLANRRYAYPFISCAHCGPRYSIVRAMPFDRDRTALAPFSLCDDCLREYRDPHDRRFHAQTIGCHACGPQVWAANGTGERLDVRDDAVRRAAAALRNGQIVALKGIGGYQLLTDATSAEAVRALRRRKRRPLKPFAVMCRSLKAARELADVCDVEAAALAGPENPIVLLRQACPGRLPDEINPGLSDLGLLLPTTALHDRLLELVERPLICTSGNRDGEPLAATVGDAVRQLGDVADLFLHHDREIVNPIDDSVVRVIANRPVTLRAGRGIAPLSIAAAEESSRPILAAGGQQKAAIALRNGVQAVLAPHVGDLDSLRTQQEWRDSSARLADLYRSRTQQVALDPHPGYFSTQWSRDVGLPQRPVWHHHAHVAAGMLEHGWLDRTVLGVAFDGTGLGPDGTIWGGEFLIATATRFRRVAHLRSFALPGGDASIVDLRRLTTALLGQLDELTPEVVADDVGLSPTDVRRTLQVAQSSSSPRTTSGGRLFDVAACLILRQTHADYEGHAAMALEAACDVSEPGLLPFALTNATPLALDWRPVLRAILSERRNGVSPGALAMRFHRGLARAILTVCRGWPHLPVVLGGGVFQNRVLTELIAADWPADGPPLGLPGRIPPNDGGLAAGQLAVAAAVDREQECVPCALASPVDWPAGSIATR